MNLSVQERLQQNQRQLQNYLYAGHDVQRINDGFCRSMVGVPTGMRQDSPRPEMRPQVGQIKTSRSHSMTCSNSSSGRSKRIRTIFTPEQLERLEAEFERQQYMVGPERLYLAHALQLTEAQRLCVIDLLDLISCAPRWGKGRPLKFSIAICLEHHASPHSTSYRCSSLLPVRCDARFAVDGHAFFSLGDSNPRLAWVCGQDPFGACALSIFTWGA
ncbi:unnamed protein product [Spodoptera exigua]|nr:unnamed protein product [Spodoptera exigua]